MQKFFSKDVLIVLPKNNYRLRGFGKLKKIQKSEKKLGSGWVGQAPTRTTWKCCVLCVVFMFPNVSKNKKKLARGVGGCYLINPSFSRIFLFFLT